VAPPAFLSAAGRFFSRHRARLVPRGSLRDRFASGVLWSLSAALLSRGFNLAASIACARLMGPTAFGELGMVQSTIAAFGAFSSLGLGLTATQYVARYRSCDPERAARVLRMSSVVSFGAGALLAGLLTLFSRALAGRVLAAPGLAAPLKLGSAIVLANAVISYQSGALAGFEAFRALARSNFASGLLSFPLIVVGAWRGGVRGAVIGTAASLAVNILINQRILRRECSRARIPLGPRPWRREAPVFWSFSMPAFLASIAVAPALWASHALLVRGPGGYDQLGLYSAADRWRLAVLFLPTTVFKAVLPMLSRLEGQADRAAYRTVNRANLALNLGLVALPAAALSCLAVPVMASYGPAFRPGWPILAVLAVGTIPEALNTVFGYPLVAGHRMWARFGFDLLLAVVLWGLGAALIPRWGAAGLAAAYVAAFTASSAGLYFLTWRSPRRERSPSPADLASPSPGEPAP
jgi:O-antigen/teichoic acid export membrane protein